MRFKNLKLATKQGLAFGFILVIMAGVTVFSLLKMSALKDEIDRVNTKRLPGVIAVSEINFNTSEYRINEMQHALTYYGYKMREQEQMMLDLKTKIEKNQDVYQPLITSPEEQQLYSEFQEKWTRYLEMHEQFMKLSRDSKDEEALTLLNEEAYKLFRDFSANLEGLVKLNKEASFEAARRAEQTYRSTRTVTMILLALTVLMSTLITLVLVRTITVPIRHLERAAKSVAEGNVNVSLDIQTEEEIGNLARSFNRMTGSLREAKQENEKQDWFKSGQNELNEKMRGDQDVQTLARNVITCLSKYLGAQIGALYLVSDGENTEMKLAGTYAFAKRKSLGDIIRIGEGLAGQAAFEKEIISVTDVPQDYIRIASAIGDTHPRNIMVSPFLYEGRLVGVVELGTFAEFTDREMEFLKYAMENIAIGFNSARSRDKIAFLLKESQRQGSELKIQQEELRATNEELAEQRDALRLSEAQLKSQQEELQAANEELEEKTQYLEKQQIEITEKNVALEIARNDIEKKAKELEVTSRYKSEFLANMSHELRTPLNSMLILARSLADNKEENLSEDQSESARIIYKSGNDLLKLINEILDLSKIEAGKMSVNIEKVSLQDIADSLHANFKHVIADKGLTLAIRLDEHIPEYMETDSQRLEQIIKNFMSNAIKFTEKGEITFSVHAPESDTDLSRSGLNRQQAIAFSVSDTGIGIPEDKLLDIFEAFQQVDGSTSRKYGGTGLGLSISRELAKLLGGEIQLKSRLGKGSTFTLYLPGSSRVDTLRFVHPTGKAGTGKAGSVRPSAAVEPAETHAEVKLPAKQKTPEVQASGKVGSKLSTLRKITAPDIQPGDRCILIIEEDADFVKVLSAQCSQKGFKAVVCASGEEGLQLAEKQRHEAIILDIRLPGMDGWAVLERLKANPQTRHIPVHIISSEEVSLDALKKGAVGFLTKPAEKEALDAAFRKLESFIEKNIKDLLVVEDDENLRKSIRKLIGNSDVQITEAASGKDALDALLNRQFDCMVLDLGLPDMTGFELLGMLKNEKGINIPPVIVYTGKDLSREEEEQLRGYAEAIIVKGVKSEERLLDETTLFLHRIVSNMPQKEQKVIANLQDKDSVFKNKKILLADDDMRNVFAMSKILREKGMEIVKAEDGAKALKVLEQEPGIHLVLMDIMMPIMDGYETMKKIREQERFAKLPVIALTAKAMKGDREKCIESGASDYLAKPVDMERLLSMMRVWLY
ncbi:MAG: hypothetical protein BWK80_04665 [Desulfobacteraceae bacterium IS3]|nr:MAG: hypothetical protein BWK80_04665 [Desulfobacteraceae bacterium IS3]